jgi:hypothetical protein
VAGDPVADGAVQDYLDAVAARLVGPRSMRTAILDELRDGLQDAVAAHRARGVATASAVRSAVHEFGAPTVVAAAFAGELATSRARRTVVAFLLTGPVVGLLWLAGLGSPRWWAAGPDALRSAVPVTPLVVAGVVAGVAVLAVTGRGGPWLRVPDRHVLHGALVVVTAASLADLALLVQAFRSAEPSTIGRLAVAAGLARLGFSLLVSRRFLSSYASLRQDRWMGADPCPPSPYDAQSSAQPRRDRRRPVVGPGGARPT